jgi:hypothetical protein
LAVLRLSSNLVGCSIGISGLRALKDLVDEDRAHGIGHGQTGTVTVMQRFASGLNLNVPFPMLLLDGVFSEARPGAHPSPVPPH